MMKRKMYLLSIALIILCLVVNVQGDVKKESTTQLDFKGTLGAVMKFFGAGKPIRTAEYYKGNVYKSDTIDEKGNVKHSQIIDLDRELFISIDHKKKQYSQMTFEEWRKMIEENMQKMEGEKEKNKSDEPQTEWSFKIDVTKPGETEMITGKKAEKVIIKLDISAKSTQQETEGSQAQTVQGDMIVTSSNWIVKEVEGQKEIESFQKKLVEKLGLLPGKGGMEEMMSKLTQNNPQLADAMKKLQEEGKKLSGVPLRIHSVYETKKVATASNTQEEAKKGTEIPTSVGGLLKGFGKKMSKSNQEDTNQNVLMESTTEVTAFEVAPVDQNAFEVPGNYKMEKQ